MVFPSQGEKGTFKKHTRLRVDLRFGIWNVGFDKAVQACADPRSRIDL